MKSLFTLFISLTITSAICFSQDTFSIVAIDSATGEVGSAGASCIGAPQIPNGCVIICDLHPGVGAINTQAYYISTNQVYAASLMDMGLAPQQIIDSLVANDVQNNPPIRQYGIVDLVDGGRSAAYTGINCDDYKNHITGKTYSIQGNILLGPEILDSMQAKFLSTPGNLACKLMAALQGAKVPGADTRCLLTGISSLSSYIRIAQPGDTLGIYYLDLVVPSAAEGVDPIDSLQTLFNQWNGCTASGIDNIIDDEIKIYPNPVHDDLTIEGINAVTSATVDFSIFDNVGRLVIFRQIPCKENCKLDISTLSKGFYFIEVETEDNLIVEKFVKQ
jgi:uncharacterized Ntn-hydrolase superfamily protein